MLTAIYLSGSDQRLQHILKLVVNKLHHQVYTQDAMQYEIELKINQYMFICFSLVSFPLKLHSHLLSCDYSMVETVQLCSCCIVHSIYHLVEIFQHFCSCSSVMSVSDLPIQSILIYLRGYSVKIYQSYGKSYVESLVQFEEFDSKPWMRRH